MATKGILLGIVFFFDILIFSVIPTYLAFNWWAYLATLNYGGEPMYTFAFLMLFLYIVAILISLIYVAATLRAFIQRNNEEGLGISRGVKWFGIISLIIIASFMTIWYLLFSELAFFTLLPPN